MVDIATNYHSIALYHLVLYNIIYVLKYITLNWLGV